MCVACTLCGCMDIATTGAEVVYNHHSLEKGLKDQYLSLQANQSLFLKSDDFKNTNIVIATYNKEMLLVGQVPEIWQKTKAEMLVNRIPDVGKVYNYLEVKNPSSALTRVNDVWITTKLKSKLIASSDVDATQIKVVTENGVVYLMGVLPSEQASAAVSLASQTDGVLHVVKMFSYMKISKIPA